MTIEEIKSLKESEDKVEFKEALHQYNYNNSRRSVIGYIVALANEGGGKMIFGIKENKSGPHTVTGSAAWQGQEGKLVEDVYRDKQIRVETEVLWEGANRILIIHIPSRPVGKTLKFEDVPLMRVGEDLLPMSDEQLFKILQEQEPDFSAKICEGLQLDDLDNVAIEKMKGKYADKQRNPSFKNKSTEQVLKDLRLSERGKLTYAALILLGKKKSIMQYLPQARIVWEFRFNEGQINHDFREAVLNAIAHRDYTITSEVVIRQYPKKIWINNPGGFPKGVTIDNLLTVSSTPRSRLMAEIMEKTGLVERSGQGVDKIFSFTLSEGKPAPSYQDSDMFQVSLKLSGFLEDKAFHLFIKEVQTSRGKDNPLDVGQIIALQKIKAGFFTNMQPELLTRLQRDGLIVKEGGHSLRYSLPDFYNKLADRERNIGSRYTIPEIQQFLLAIQGRIISIGELEKVLQGALNRNQIKYLSGKLYEDGIIASEGVRKGTKYKLSFEFEPLFGDTLIDRVIYKLQKMYAKEISHPSNGYSARMVDSP